MDRHCVATVLSAFAWTIPSAAGTPAGETEPLIEEVVVTATKRERGAYDVPAALSVLDGGGLAARGIADLVDIGKFVPNLNVTTFSAGHTSSANPFIRGIGTQDHLITTDPGVGVYVDGVYLGRQVGQHWNLSNVERVEVLRGPQGTLYGRNSIGGAINIVTAAPGVRPGALARVRIGSRGRVDTHFHADTELGDAFAATFSAGVNQRGGVGGFVNLPNAGVEVGETQELFGRVALGWRPSAALSLTLAADANDGENGLNPYTTLIDELPYGAVYAAGYRNAQVSADPYDSNTGQQDQARVANAARGVAFTADWAFTTHLSAEALASVRHSEYEAGLDDDGFLDDFLSFPETGEADQTSVEARLNGEFGGIDFVAGVYRFAEDGANVQEPTVFLGLPGAFYLGQELDSTAVFGSLGVEMAERWRLAGGLRTTRDRKRATTDVGTGPVSARREWRETSWDLSAHYRIGDRVAAYAAVQSGYQSGQFPARPYCLFADPDCFAAGDNITAVNHEVGAKGQPLDRLELSAAVFHTRYGDLPYQVSTTSGAGFTTVNLIVEQRTTGFEWESRWYVTERLELNAALGWTRVDVERRRGVRPVAPLTPEWTWSASSRYRWPLGDGAEVTARVDWSYRGRMWGEPSSDRGRLTGIGSRGLINFHVAYEPRGGAWTVAVYGRNVTDERYDNARLNTGDYVLRMLSNDASEFGLLAETRF